MNLPTVIAADSSVSCGHPTALEQFISDCQPYGHPQAKKFRDGLVAVIKEMQAAHNEHLNRVRAEMQADQDQSDRLAGWSICFASACLVVMVISLCC